MVRRVLYVSTISAELCISAITRLVAAAQRRNRQLDLTGALLKCDGHFAQVLEGRDEVVTAMMAKIEADRRHTDLRVHDCGTVQRRAFADWDMAFIISADCSADVIG